MQEKNVFDPEPFLDNPDKIMNSAQVGPTL